LTPRARDPKTHRLVNPPRKLVTLYLSPWSERARWALDHHGVEYRVVQHIPVVGERRLRRLVGRDKPRATVPVLLAEGEVLSESWDIGRYADRVGKGTPLIAPEHEAAIRTWQSLADRAMSAARGRIVARTIASDAALDESAPPGTPRWARGLLRPASRLAMRLFGRKYGVDLDDEHGPTHAMREALGELRRGLAGGGYVLGAFSYADIVLATLLQGVSPVADRYLRLGPATRRVWTHDALALEFADLVAWRDRLYDSHRARRAASA
jgi:glutathione S-transferase